MSRESITKSTIHQMMKGPRSFRTNFPIEQKQAMLAAHGKQVQWILNLLPRHSAALYAVTTKCLIRYGKTRVMEWCDALLNCSFKGQNDPAYLLWVYLQKCYNQNTLDVYRRSLCAAKAYMENRTLGRIEPIITDVFEWEENFTIPKQYVDGYREICEWVERDQLYIADHIARKIKNSEIKDNKIEKSSEPVKVKST